ncbi:hypothetical protein [Zobellia sp. 1_MG-2023]|uniref:hypothetical protein n=1 Tax=Zobellia sp. 1_MG-2023 TaxID=3062626 RepID=UPI0026E263B0|nr:hypothetical protein [Zobellia sp. 1_MG-2023]MDO6819318.1 hypothetical protein [Zobellia sp. 1_MG-2023]
MELDRIEKLLKKYFEAETTVAEEKELRAFFSKGEVPENLEQYIPLFSFTSGAKKEQLSKEIVLEPKTTGSSRSLYKWMSIAAAVVLMFGVYLGKTYYDEKELEQQQALYAYNETKKALDMLSQNMERGTEKMGYLNEFVVAKQKIYNKK